MLLYGSFAQYTPLSHTDYLSFPYMRHCFSLLKFLLLQVIEMPEHNPGQLGGTMRLGRRRTVFVEDCDSITSMKLCECCDIQLHLTCWASMLFNTHCSV